LPGFRAKKWFRVDSTPGSLFFIADEVSKMNSQRSVPGGLGWAWVRGIQARVARVNISQRAQVPGFREGIGRVMDFSVSG
jgi:hypothetical protein